MEVLYRRCAGLDVHKDTVVAGLRLAEAGSVITEIRSFATTTPGLLALSAWLGEHGCTHVAMEATGIGPVAKFFRTRFVRKLRSAEPVLSKL